MQTATHPVREVRIPLAEGTLFGDLIEPAGSSALVLFVNGRGHGRHCVEDRRLASPVHGSRVSTLLLDLLTVDEQQQHPQGGQHGMDVALLTRRVMDIAEWLRQQPELASLPLGLCGVSAGTAPALIAAARLGAQVQALVCVAGSPDQAGPTVLASIKAPTLLLAGSRDAERVAVNEAAYRQLRG
ncbi:MAG: acyl-CoA thioester hydrolase/BAAT C-terminal domain-containing protein, partial [Pseudomonadota bacterium]